MPIYDNWTTYDPIVSMLPIYKELIGAGLKIWVFRYMYGSLQRVSCPFLYKKLTKTHVFFFFFFSSACTVVTRTLRCR